MFSSVMHGASLLYILLLSQMRERPEWIEKYEERLADWRAGLDMRAIRAWSLDTFWLAIDHPAHRIRPAAKRFVTDWLALIKSGGVSVGQLTEAARLVQDRERRLKTSQSRFANRAVRDRWTGASGAEPLSFRWAHAPHDPADDAWPHRAVREVIEEVASDELERGIQVERFNMRGVYSKDPYDGGGAERALAVPDTLAALGVGATMAEMLRGEIGRRLAETAPSLPAASAALAAAESIRIPRTPALFESEG